MFTGIIEEVGRVISMSKVDNLKLWDGYVVKELIVGKG